MRFGAFNPFGQLPRSNAPFAARRRGVNTEYAGDCNNFRQSRHLLLDYKRLYWDNRGVVPPKLAPSAEAAPN